jgi:hypothetical protein
MAIFDFGIQILAPYGAVHFSLAGISLMQMEDESI